MFTFLKEYAMKKKNENKIWKKTGSVFFLVIVVVIVSSYLYQSFQIDLIMTDMHALHKKKKQLLSETESLQAEVNRLSNIDRISRIANQDFDLHFSDEEQLVIKIEDADNFQNLKEQFAQEDSKIQKINTAGIQ
jgi:cell division protein FtsL